MTGLVACRTEALPNGEPCFHIEMRAPRANALEPVFLGELHGAFDALERSGARKALLIGGRNFSSGGDVGRFYEAALAGQATAYTEQVVPVLQALVLRMIELPVIVASSLRGAVTGGSSGLIFASDLVVAAPDAFMQPYYGTVGFAPDGGWLAILPELIGGAAARSWISTNQRNDAETLKTFGLVQDVDPTPELRALTLLNALDTNTACASKALWWDEARRAQAKDRLEAETRAFSALIDRPETQAKMHAFLQPNG